MSHSRDSTMVEDKLVHTIVTARTLPRGDRRETNTHTEKINPNVSPYSSFLAFFHLNTYVYSNAHPDFFSFT